MGQVCTVHKQSTGPSPWSSVWNILKLRDSFLPLPARLPGSDSNRTITNGNHCLPGVTQFPVKQRGRHRAKLPQRSLQERLSFLQLVEAPAVSSFRPHFRIEMSYKWHVFPRAVHTPFSPHPCHLSLTPGSLPGKCLHQQYKFTASLDLRHWLTSAYPAFLFVSQVWLLQANPISASISER